MSDQEINRTLAEACGWKFEQTEEGGKITYPCGFASEFSPISWAEEKFLKTIPNYCKDLNAIHEEEKNLDQEQAQNYTDALRIIPQDKNWAGCTMWHFSPRQKAEAFLRAIGKWKEAK